jgi:hypothetical protein
VADAPLHGFHTACRSSGGLFGVNIWNTVIFLSSSEKIPIIMNNCQWLAHGCSSTWFTAGGIVAISRIRFNLRILKFETPIQGVSISNLQL